MIKMKRIVALMLITTINPFAHLCQQKQPLVQWPVIELMLSAEAFIVTSSSTTRTATRTRTAIVNQRRMKPFRQLPCFLVTIQELNQRQRKKNHFQCTSACTSLSVHLDDTTDDTCISETFVDTTTSPSFLVDVSTTRTGKSIESSSCSTRRTMLNTIATTTTTTAGAATILSTILLLSSSNSEPALALVRGNVPPSSSSSSSSSSKDSTSTSRPRCTNLEECQAQAELREQQQRIQDESESVPILTTSKGNVRYRDYTTDTGTDTATTNDNTTNNNRNNNNNDLIVQDGDTVSMYYKVLKLGKRSYDGISGEGTVIFSKGYGLEDDEMNSNTNSNNNRKTFQTRVGSDKNIIALNEALIGTRVGTKRRFSIRPEQGWRKPNNKQCDGGPGGSGIGGELRTDYVVVPTATMVDEEKCFDTTKVPFPTQYAQQRRMAQRFDQSLIMEIEIVSIQR